MKISKCCGSSFTRNENEMFGGNYNICDKCGAFCDTIEQKIDNFFPKSMVDKYLENKSKKEKEEIKKEIEELKFDEEIQNDGGIKYNEAKNSSDALIQFGYNQALQEIKEAINKMIER